MPIVRHSERFSTNQTYPRTQEGQEITNISPNKVPYPKSIFGVSSTGNFDGFRGAAAYRAYLPHIPTNMAEIVSKHRGVQVG